MSVENNQEVPNVEIPPEMAERLIYGDINLAEFLGLTRGTLYAIAGVGYQMLTSGKLEQAQQIYQGLVAADPYDSVFHCHLAAAHHKLGDFEKALEEYSESLKYNRANIDALAGRGEIYFNRGHLSDAVKDLKSAIDLDPQGKLASTVRARAIIVALKEMVDSHKAASN